MTDDLPSDTVMLNWLQQHPEVVISNTGAYWRLRQEVRNGYGVTGTTVRECFEVIMMRDREGGRLAPK